MSEADQTHGDDGSDAGRRRLLKAVAVAGGAVAATTVLPGNWVKPAIEMGVLPAEAAGPSAVPTSTTPDNRPQLSAAELLPISGSPTWALFVKHMNLPAARGLTTNNTAGFLASCNYYDPLGKFDPATWTLYTREQPCGIEKNTPMDGAGISITPVPVNGFVGNFSFFKHIECNGGSTGLAWWISGDGRTSEEISKEVPAKS